jgi:hypothetical protein
MAGSGAAAVMAMRWQAGVESSPNEYNASADNPGCIVLAEGEMQCNDGNVGRSSNRRAKNKVVQRASTRWSTLKVPLRWATPMGFGCYITVETPDLGTRSKLHFLFRRRRSFSLLGHAGTREMSMCVVSVDGM